MSAPSTSISEEIRAIFRATDERLTQIARERQESQKEFDRFVQESRKESQRRDEESRRRFEESLEKSRKEFDRRMRESEKKFNRQMAKFGDSIGELVAAMVEGGVVRLFRKEGYTFTSCSRRKEFENKELGVAGEIDLFLENGEYALLVEVKTNLSEKDVKKHVIRLKKFRIDADARGDKRRFLAAVGGGVVRKEVQKFASKQGMFVIQQSGENVEIIAPERNPRMW